MTRTPILLRRHCARAVWRVFVAVILVSFVFGGLTAMAANEGQVPDWQEEYGPGVFQGLAIAAIQHEDQRIFVLAYLGVAQTHSIYWNRADEPREVATLHLVLVECSIYCSLQQRPVVEEFEVLPGGSASLTATTEIGRLVLTWTPNGSPTAGGQRAFGASQIENGLSWGMWLNVNVQSAVASEVSGLWSASYEGSLDGVSLAGTGHTALGVVGGPYVDSFEPGGIHLGAYSIGFTMGEVPSQ